VLGPVALVGLLIDVLVIAVVFRGRFHAVGLVEEPIVVDRTSLQERFDLELEWAPDVFPQLPLLLNSPDRPPTGRPDSSAPSIFTAVREQLGLSLEPSRGDVDVFVIDRAERPAPN